MTTKIDKKITGYKVVTDESKPAAPVQATKLAKRPTKLSGSTYKIEPTPSNEHAIYVTINDSEKTPYEIFLNTKCPDTAVWTQALTRVLSGCMRKGGNIDFLVEELKTIPDPIGGGYFRKGVGAVPSLVSEVGMILEEHLQGLRT
jgi:hypothetical protein